MTDEVLAIIQASAPRRGFGVGVLGLLGVMLVYIAVAQPPAELGWQVFLIVFGLTILWFAGQMWRATKTVIELTATELRTSEGALITEIAGIKAVDRGTFAFKPSNGFMLKLTDKAPRAWQPGLYWRIGRRVGVGGVTSAAQTKNMAEIIAAMVAAR